MIAAQRLLVYKELQLGQAFEIESTLLVRR